MTASAALLLALLPAAGRVPLVAPKPPAADDTRAARFADPRRAAAEADRTGKPLVIVLTDTDYCAPCAALDAAVFDRGPFARAAGELVLLHVDTAGEGTDPAVRDRYEGLAARYRTRAIPTVIVADAAGRPLGVTGHPDGRPGPRRYRAHLRELAGRRPVRDAAFARAETLAGPAKAAALHAGLAAVWGADGDDHAGMLLSEYAPEVAALLAADPGDAPGDGIGFAPVWRDRLAAQSGADRVAGLRDRLGAAYDADGIDAALAVEGELIAAGLTPTERSATDSTVTVLLSWAGRYDAAAARTGARLRGFDSAFAPPTDRERWYFRERLAYYAGRSGRVAEAARLYRAVVEDLLAAGDRELAYKFARSRQQYLVGARRFDDALALLDEDPLRSPPASADPGDRAFLRFTAHRRAGRFAEAAAACLELAPRLADGWNRVSWRNRAAGLLLAAGDRAGAAAALDAAAAVPRPAGDAEAAALYDRLAAEAVGLRRRLAGPVVAPKPPAAAAAD